MRGILFLSAAVVASLTLGCFGPEPEVYPREQPRVASSGPRANLYPMTAAPAGPSEPMLGYAPTRITASYAPGPAQPPPGDYAYAGQQGDPMTPPPGPALDTVQAMAPPPVNFDSFSATPASFTPPPAYGPPAAAVVPPLPPRLSAVSSYAPPPPPVYRRPAAPYAPAPAYAPPAGPTGVHFGPVEGTADIVGFSPAIAAIPTTPPSDFGMTSAPIVTQPYMGQAYPAAVATIPGMTPAPYAMPAAPAAPALFAANDIRLVPALDVPPGVHPGDAGPSQWFEVVRPNNAAIRIGRLSATCVCVGVRVAKRQFAAGERVLIEARMLERPPVNNLTYGIFVNVVEPVQTMLDADVTIDFSQWR